MYITKYRYKKKIRTGRLYNCVNTVHAIKAGILYRIYIKHNSGTYMHVYR